MAEQNFPTGTLMAGKRGLIMGVANKNSIAWPLRVSSRPKAQNLPLPIKVMPCSAA